jgi:hypothetical protein
MQHDAKRVLIETREATIEAHPTIEEEKLGSLIYEALSHLNKGCSLATMEILAEAVSVMQFGFIEETDGFGPAMQKFADNAAKFRSRVAEVRHDLAEKYKVGN